MPGSKRIGRPPLPEGEVASRRVTFRMKPALADKLEREASKRGMDASGLIRLFVLEGLGLEPDKRKP